MKMRSGKHAWTFYTVLVLAYSLVFWFWRTQALSASVHWAGVLVLAVALAPLAAWYRRGHQGVPIFELICLAFGVDYSLPLYRLPNQILIMGENLELPWETTTRALLQAAVGVGVLIAGYYAARNALAVAPGFHADLPLAPRLRGTYILCALGLGLAAKVYLTASASATEGLGAVLRLVASQFEIGIILLAYQVFSERRPALWRTGLLWGCVVLSSLFGLSGGELEFVIIPFVLVLIVHWQVRRRFPAGLALVVAAIVLVLTPVKAEYRDRVWYGEQSGLGAVARLRVWLEAGRDVYFGKAVPDEDYGLQEKDPTDGLVGRLDLLHKLVYVQTMTPAEVPFFRGRTYGYLMYSPVPRFLWPGKPLATEATDLVDFSYRFRSPSAEKQDTRIAIGQIAEAYANFGWPGIVVVMLLQGVFFAALDKVLNGPRSDGGRAIYLSVMVLFLNGIGTAAVILFGFIPQYILASALLMRPFALGFRLRAEARRPRLPRRAPQTA